MRSQFLKLSFIPSHLEMSKAGKKKIAIFELWFRLRGELACLQFVWAKLALSQIRAGAKSCGLCTPSLNPQWNTPPSEWTSGALPGSSWHLRTDSPSPPRGEDKHLQQRREERHKHHCSKAHFCLSSPATLAHLNEENSRRTCVFFWGSFHLHAKAAFPNVLPSRWTEHSWVFRKKRWRKK